MKNNKIHQLLVLDGKTLSGIVELKDLVTKEINPKITKVHNYVTKTPIISPKDDVEKAIELLLNSGNRALPVADKGSVVGIISETDIIKHINSGLNNPAKGLSAKCECVDKTDTIGKVKKIMQEKNISRIPVLDEGKVIGIVDTMDLIRVFSAEDGLRVRNQDIASKEKLHIDGITVNNIMSPVNVLGKDATIGDVVNVLKNSEGAVIENGDVCIITPKDILELFVPKPKRGVYVQITGMRGEGAEFQNRMDKRVEEFVQKMGRMVKNIDYLFIHVEKMNIAGTRAKYSIRARFRTPFGMFVAHAWGWKPLDVIQIVFNKLETEITRKNEKRRDMKMERRRGRR
jgi:CBS domain-containing protein